MCLAWDEVGWWVVVETEDRKGQSTPMDGTSAPSPYILHLCVSVILVFTHMCMRVDIHMYVHEYSRLAMGVFIDHSPP